jgi:hypothetical protein
MKKNHEELHNLYYSPSEMGSASSTHGRDVKYMQNFGWKNWREQATGMIRSRWEDNIRMDLKLGWESVDWILVAQDRVKWRDFVNMVMNFRIKWKTGNLFTSKKASASQGLWSVELVLRKLGGFDSRITTMKKHKANGAMKTFLHLMTSQLKSITLVSDLRNPLCKLFVLCRIT